MTIDINIIATVFSVIASAIAIVVAISKRGKTDGTMQSDIGYIKSGIDDIKRKQEKQDDFNMQVNTRLTQVEQSAKQAHKRIDTLENHYHPD